MFGLVGEGTLTLVFEVRSALAYRNFSQDHNYHDSKHQSFSMSSCRADRKVPKFWRVIFTSLCPIQTPQIQFKFDRESPESSEVVFHHFGTLWQKCLFDSLPQQNYYVPFMDFQRIFRGKTLAFLFVQHSKCSWRIHPENIIFPP